MQDPSQLPRTPSESWRTGGRSNSLHSRGDYSAFLRSALADEESLQLSEHLQRLAQQVEATMALLQQPGVDMPAVAQALLGLVEQLRGLRSLLLSLGGDWHHFYEFDALFSAYNQFRVALTRWARQAAPPELVLPSPSEFDVIAWRVLGAGAMLLDVYEQSRAHAYIPLSPQPQPVDAATWWQRVRTWWGLGAPRRKDQRQPGKRGRRASD